MRHQPWDPFSANSNEPVGSVTVEHDPADWQRDLLALSAFIQGFSEQMSEVLTEIQRTEHLSCRRSTF
ncbi:MAG: hypothetical protein VCA55_12040 [Verrucomicrobiales bacterium]